MKTFYPEKFLALTSVLSHIRAQSGDSNRDDDQILGESVRNFFRDNLPRFEADCTAMGLRATTATIRRFIEFIGQEEPTYGKLRDLAKDLFLRLTDEMQQTHFISISADKAKFFSEINLFGAEVGKRFPNATTDIEEAGKCLALGRTTAAVFHLMRVMEKGLQSFAARLNVSRIQDTNWQTILDQATSEVKKLPNTTTKERRKIAKYHSVLAHLSSVKTAWRNEVMHPKDTYTEEQAEDIFNHVRAFMRELTTLLNTRR